MGFLVGSGVSGHGDRGFGSRASLEITGLGFRIDLRGLRSYAADYTFAGLP